MAVAAAINVRLKLGSGVDRPVRLHAGKFLIEKANENLLAGRLPPLTYIAADDPSLGRIRSLLTMNEMEARQPGRASGFVVVRLVELILVEILRTTRLRTADEEIGLLAGLADPVTVKALTAMHRNVAYDWTVEALAKLCGVSKSTFAHKFRAIVGAAPIDYLLRWRISLAKEELSRGRKSVSEIAFAVGFQSSSAFSTAFTNAIGHSPRRFARLTKADAS